MRFILIENNNDFPNDGETCWYWDTNRLVPEANRDNPEWPWIAVQCYCGKDPNNFVQIEPEKFRILYTDKAEYYFVCPNCYDAYCRMQWSGSTRGPGNWRERAEREKEIHAHKKGWCEFCDPVFGSGGWAI